VYSIHEVNSFAINRPLAGLQLPYQHTLLLNF
jgi:hypothetical protein